MTRLERWSLGTIIIAGACVACSPTRYYVGLPPIAAATTFCDEAGQIRSALDANLFKIAPDGTVVAMATIKEILVHEGVHRAQAEARRPAPGKCPKAFTWMQLVDDEIEAYCASAAVADSNHANMAVVGTLYAGALLRQFTPWIGPGAKDYIAPRWLEACPNYPLVWPT